MLFKREPTAPSAPSTHHSSTKPKYVDDLKGARVFDVACGYAGTLALLDVTTADARGALSGPWRCRSGRRS
jgi:hypothetical protein